MICRIRPYQATDAEALWQAARESVAEVLPWLQWCHPEYSMAEAADWVTSKARLAGEGHEFAFAIVGADGRFLGGCGVNQIDRIHRFGNLGYWVRSSATGRGVASEAARQVAEFAFRDTDLAQPPPDGLCRLTSLWCIVPAAWGLWAIWMVVRMVCRVLALDKATDEVVLRRQGSP